MGAASSVREIVKERPIYQRERSIGLSATAYLWSKVVVLSGVVTLQALVLTVLALAGRKGAADPLVLGSSILEIAVAVVALTIASAMLGLVISAWVNNADKAMPMLVLMIMVQLIFSGGLVPLAGRPGLEQVSYVVPGAVGLCHDGRHRGSALHRDGAYPAVLRAARSGARRRAQLPPDLLSSTDAAEINQICHHKPPRVDVIWRHDSVTWFGDLWVLLALSGVSIMVVAILLRRLEPKRRAGQVGQVAAPPPGAWALGGYSR